MYFDVSTANAAPPVRQTWFSRGARSPTNEVLLVIFSIALFIGGGILARRNLRLGYGDTRGGRRLCDLDRERRRLVARPARASRAAGGRRVDLSPDRHRVGPGLDGVCLADLHQPRALRATLVAAYADLVGAAALRARPRSIGRPRHPRRTAGRHRDGRTVDRAGGGLAPTRRGRQPARPGVFARGAAAGALFRLDRVLRDRRLEFRARHARHAAADSRHRSQPARQRDHLGVERGDAQSGRRRDALGSGVRRRAGGLCRLRAPPLRAVLDGGDALLHGPDDAAADHIERAVPGTSRCRCSRWC